MFLGGEKNYTVFPHREENSRCPGDAEAGYYEKRKTPTYGDGNKSPRLAGSRRGGEEYAGGQLSEEIYIKGNHQISGQLSRGRKKNQPPHKQNDTGWLFQAKSGS